MNVRISDKTTLLQMTSLLLFISIISISLGCDQEETIIPITTNSQIAREHYLTGREYSENLRAIDARGHFRQAIEVDPDFAMAHLLLAFSLTSQQELLATLSEATARVKLLSEGEQLTILASEAGVNGDPALQEELLEKLITIYPLDKRAHMALGNFFFVQQQYQKAISEYRKIKQLDPEFALPYNMSGYSHRRLGRYKEAEAAFLKYIKLIPNDPNPYDSYAELLLKMGEFEESIESYRKALEQDSGFVASYVGIATDLAHLGQHDAARAELQKLYDIAPDEGGRRNALFNIAMTHIDETDYLSAMAQLERRLSIAVNLGDSGTVGNDLFIISLLQIEQGQFTQAKLSLDRLTNAVEASTLSEVLKVNNRRGQLFLKTVLALEQGDIETSRTLSNEYFTKVEATNNPLQIMTGFQLKGRIAMAENNWAQAIKDLNKANHQNPYNLYRLAVAHKEAGEISKSKARAREAAEFNLFLLPNYVMIRQQAIDFYKSIK